MSNGIISYGIEEETGPPGCHPLKGRICHMAEERERKKMPQRKTEITVMQENDSGQMVLMDRCTLTAESTADAARAYAALFGAVQRPDPAQPREESTA